MWLVTRSIERSAYADTLYSRCSAGPRGRPAWWAAAAASAGRLGEYIASRDSLALDPARISSEEQLRHAMAHELAHRWQARLAGAAPHAVAGRRADPRHPPLRPQKRLGAPGGGGRVRGAFPPDHRRGRPGDASLLPAVRAAGPRHRRAWPDTSPCSRSTPAIRSAGCSPRETRLTPAIASMRRSLWSRRSRRCIPSIDVPDPTALVAAALGRDAGLGARARP